MHYSTATSRLYFRTNPYLSVSTRTSYAQPHAHQCRYISEISHFEESSELLEQ